MLKNSLIVPEKRDIVEALRETERKQLFNMIRHYFDAVRFDKLFKQNGGMVKFGEIKNELINLKKWVVEERNKPSKIRDKQKIVEYEEQIKVKEQEGERFLIPFKDMEDALNGAKVEAEMIQALREIIKNPNTLLDYDFKKN